MPSPPSVVLEGVSGQCHAADVAPLSKSSNGSSAQAHDRASMANGEGAQDGEAARERTDEPEAHETIMASMANGGGAQDGEAAARERTDEPEAQNVGKSDHESVVLQLREVE